jgi:HPt (histidine-containing phosphotransfer) domain-containing protein
MNKKWNLINMSYLDSISNGDKKFIQELIDLFFEQIPDYQSKLISLNESKDWNNLARIAHKAKSAIIMMGMNDLALELKKLEENAKEEKNIGDYQEIIVKFVNDTNSALAELRDIKEKIT